MQNNQLSAVKKMHDKFGINFNQLPHFNEHEKQFRIACLQEELDEYRDATAPEDELDALVDLIVFAFGTVERQGFEKIFDRAFYRVMKANMQKQLGPNNKRGGFSIDLQKPEGWVSPKHHDLILELYND